jgi:hypothetical protein
MFYSLSSVTLESPEGCYHVLRMCLSTSIISLVMARFYAVLAAACILFSLMQPHSGSGLDKNSEKELQRMIERTNSRGGQRRMREARLCLPSRWKTTNQVRDFKNNIKITQINSLYLAFRSPAMLSHKSYDT